MEMLLLETMHIAYDIRYNIINYINNIKTRV